LLGAVDAGVGVTPLLAIPADTRCWLQRPPTPATTSRSPGAVRTKRGGVAPEAAPRSVAAGAASLPASHGSQRPAPEGTTGPMTYAWARPRVTLCQEGLPERTVWLVMQRTRGEAPPYPSAIRHAPVSTPGRPVIWRSRGRGAEEQWWEESKTAPGLAHYGARKSPGWHHQRLTPMLAHVFVWPMKRRGGKKSARADGVAGADALGSGLAPARVYRGRDVGVRPLGAAAQSSCLSGAEKAAGDRKLNKVSL
jgi:hypothetical protein